MIVPFHIILFTRVERLSHKLFFFKDYYDGIVSSPVLELMHSSLYVVIFKESFPKYSKKLKIRE
jgi:hypothetical protein